MLQEEVTPPASNGVQLKSPLHGEFPAGTDLLFSVLLGRKKYVPYPPQVPQDLHIRLANDRFTSDKHTEAHHHVQRARVRTRERSGRGHTERWSELSSCSISAKHREGVET